MINNLLNLGCCVSSVALQSEACCLWGCNMRPSYAVDFKMHRLKIPHWRILHNQDFLTIISRHHLNPVWSCIVITVWSVSFIKCFLVKFICFSSACFHSLLKFSLVRYLWLLESDQDRNKHQDTLKHWSVSFRDHYRSIDHAPSLAYISHGGQGKRFTINLRPSTWWDFIAQFNCQNLGEETGFTGISN